MVMMAGPAQAFRVGKVLKTDDHAVDGNVGKVCKRLHGFNLFLKKFL